MSRYNSIKSNPFEDDQDDFVHVPKQSQGRSFGPSFVDDRRQFSRLVNESEDRQLESTHRALASLYESEAMGNATAEELLRQREVIQNIEQKTDEINSTLTMTQRHLNNIKSVFGGIKNWWGTKKETPAPQPEQKRGSSLDSLVKKNQEGGDGLAAGSSGRTWSPDGYTAVGGDSLAAGSSGRTWSPDGYTAVGGGGYADSDLDSRFMANAPSSRIGSSGLGGLQSQQFVQPITGSAREEELNKNLGMMSDGLGRLKDLARGLGDEIDMQNADLDRITPKVGRANDLLDNQNTQMNKILK